jgi:hypothetical protein
MSANAPSPEGLPRILRMRGVFCGRTHGYRDGMVTLALRATSHVAAWIVWQSMRVSLLDDLAAPRPPAEELARKAA